MRDSRIHSVRFHYGDRQTAEMEKENYIMKPLILLTGGTGAAANGTPTWALNQNYAENIRRAGGIPILAVSNDCAEEYADLADGLLLSGGKDVEPKLYGQEKMFDFVITDPQRDDLEYKIIKAFVDRRKPIWGICRGIQILNVYFGGTLTQDIPTQLEGCLPSGDAQERFHLRKPLRRVHGSKQLPPPGPRQARRRSPGHRMGRVQRTHLHRGCAARDSSDLVRTVAPGAHDRPGYKPEGMCRLSSDV